MDCPNNVRELSKGKETKLYKEITGSDGGTIRAAANYSRYTPVPANKKNYLFGFYNEASIQVPLCNHAHAKTQSTTPVRISNLAQEATDVHQRR